jgi:hypothetical protein
MAIAHVQDSTPATGAGVTSLATSFTSSVTAGNLVVVHIGLIAQGVTVTSVTDNKGNSYSQAVTKVNNFGNRVSIWYSFTTSGGSSFQVTANFSAICTVSVVATEASGATALDTTNSNSGTSTAPTPGSINTALADEVVFVFELNVQLTAVNPPSGYTGIYNDTTMNGSECAYQIYSATQTGLNPSWSTANNSYVACIAAFQGSGTTGPTGGCPPSSVMAQVAAPSLGGPLVCCQPNDMPDG